MMFKTTLRFFMAFTVLMAMGHAAKAQSKTFDDVLKVFLTNKGAIMNGNEVSGYYFFYQVEKAEKGKMNYLLKILDNNLNEVASKSITDDKGTVLRECVFNGKSLMLKFQSPGKEAKYKFKQYSLTGERRSTKSIKVGNLDYSSEGLAQLSEGALMPTVFSVGDKGFVNYIYENDGGLKQTRYVIDFIPEDSLSGKAWKAKSDAKSEAWEYAIYVANDDKVLISNIAKRLGKMTRDVEYYIMATDLATGKQIYETSIEDDKYSMQLLNGKLEGDNVRLYGLYYPKDAKTAKEKSLGLCSVLLDATGKATERKYLSWASDVSKFLPTNDKGRIEDVGYLFFHNFIKAPDGTVFGVAESYRKAASAGGIASTVLSGNRAGVSTAKMVIEDFYLFQFTPDFQLKGVKIMDKNRDDVPLISGFEWMNPQVLSLVMLYSGGFDYAFTQQNKDNTLFTIGYLDYEDRKGEKDGWSFGTLNYLDNEWVNDKIKMTSSSRDFDVLPAKPGYVMVFEYFRKQKRIDVRLEKLNL